LPKDANIQAAEYSLYLPEKELLQSKLAEWVEEFEAQKKRSHFPRGKAAGRAPSRLRHGISQTNPPNQRSNS
jgi:hypothetical protein